MCLGCINWWKFWIYNFHLSTARWFSLSIVLQKDTAIFLWSCAIPLARWHEIGKQCEHLEFSKCLGKTVTKCFLSLTKASQARLGKNNTCFLWIIWNMPPPPPKTSVSISNPDKNGSKSIQNDSEICCFKAPKTGGKIREFVVTILEAWLPLEMTWSLRTRDNFWSQVLIPVRTMEELEGARWWVEWVGFDWWGPAWLNRKECCSLVVKTKIPIFRNPKSLFWMSGLELWTVWSW